MDAFKEMIANATSGILGSLSKFADIDPNATAQLELEQEELATFGKPMTQEETVNWMSPDSEIGQVLTKPPTSVLGPEWEAGELANFGFDTPEDTAAAYADFPDQQRANEELAATTGTGEQSFGEAGMEFLGGMGAPEQQFAEDFDISDSTKVAELVDANVTRDARQMEQMALDRAKPIIESGNAEQNKSLWQMVTDAGEVIGKPLGIAYDSWMKLAPSTRLALIGTAATAYAYNKGWKKTAGDTAKISAGLYGNMYGQETQAQAGVDAADLKARADAAKAKPTKPTYTEGDRTNISSQVENIVTQSGEFDSWIPFMSDPEKKAQYIASLTDEYLAYTGGVQENMVAVPILKYLKLKQQSQQQQ